MSKNKKPKISLLIPIYNEQWTISEVLSRISQANYGEYQPEIIVVDDKSTDQSWAILQRLKAKYKFKLYRHSRNRGKGAGIQTALRKATGEIVITQDADLEYHPKDIIRLIKRYHPQKRPVVYGSRNLGTSPRGYLATHLAGQAINRWFNLLFGSKLTDLHTGYKLFRKDILLAAKLRQPGFDFCHEATARVIKMGFPIVEVPIGYSARSFAEGKKVRWTDAWVDLVTTTRERFKS